MGQRRHALEELPPPIRAALQAFLRAAKVHVDQLTRVMALAPGPEREDALLVLSCTRRTFEERTRELTGLRRRMRAEAMH